MMRVWCADASGSIGTSWVIARAVSALHFISTSSDIIPCATMTALTLSNADAVRD
jgi:hypothetical protein